MRAKHVWVALTVVLVLAAAMAGAAALAWRQLETPLPLPEEGAWLRVESGTPLRRVTASLAERGLLRQPWLLATYARLTGDATRVRTGEYQLVKGTTPRTLLEKLVSGDVYLHQITIVEGSRFADVLAALRSHPAIEATPLDGAAIMAALGAPSVHPEGQFFPDTYRFPLGTPDLEVLRAAHDELAARLQAVWRERSPDVKLANDYEALILASII